MDETILQDLRSGPALSSSVPSADGDSSQIAREFRADSVGSADGRESSLPPPPPAPAATRTSFAQVTSMGGNYPVLLPTTPAQGQVQRTLLDPLPSESRSASRWRAMGAGVSSPSPSIDSPGAPWGEQSQMPPTTPHSSGKGKGKGKSSSRKNEISLLSNSTSRSYR